MMDEETRDCLRRLAEAVERLSWKHLDGANGEDFREVARVAAMRVLDATKPEPLVRRYRMLVDVDEKDAVLARGAVIVALQDAGHGPDFYVHPAWLAKDDDGA